MSAEAMLLSGGPDGDSREGYGEALCLGFASWSASWKVLGSRAEWEQGGECQVAWMWLGTSLCWGSPLVGHVGSTETRLLGPVGGVTSLSDHQLRKCFWLVDSRPWSWQETSRLVASWGWKPGAENWIHGVSMSIKVSLRIATPDIQSLAAPLASLTQGL